MAMSIDVLQDRLLLLQRLEAMHPDVASRGVKHSVNRCGQVPAPSFPSPRASIQPRSTMRARMLRASASVRCITRASSVVVNDLGVRGKRRLSHVRNQCLDSQRAVRPAQLDRVGVIVPG